MISRLHAIVAIGALIALGACSQQQQLSDSASFRKSYADTFIASCVQPKPGDAALAKGCGCAIKAILLKYPSNEQLNEIQQQLNSGAVSPPVKEIFGKCFPKPKK